MKHLIQMKYECKKYLSLRNSDVLKLIVPKQAPPTVNIRNNQDIIDLN